MLEVKNLTFKVEENGVKRSIVKDVSFQVDAMSARASAITAKRWK